MASTTKSKLVAAPRCRSCGRAIGLSEGIVADSTYCRHCSAARHEAAKRTLDLRPISDADFLGPYVLQRRRHAV